MRSNSTDIAQKFWIMGINYLRLTQAVSGQIARQRNRLVIISDSLPAPAEYERKTKWSDGNLAVPVLFNLYHGIELTLKGFVLCQEGAGAKLNHGLEHFYARFMSCYPAETRMIVLVGNYVDKAKTSQILRRFLQTNKLSVDRLYESLRYPFNRDLSVGFSHLVLKYKGGDGVAFYRALAKDTKQMIQETIRIGKSLMAV